MKQAPFWLMALAFLPAAAVAKNGPPLPPAVTDVSACRRIAGAAERLACFDKSAAALDAAIAGDKVVVIDQAEVKQTRRSLFGLTALPRLGLFGDDDGPDAIKQLDFVASVASQDGEGNWRVTMGDGTVWAQTDGLALGRAPRAGSKITIRRAALGSFKMSVDGQPSVRAKRVL